MAGGDEHQRPVELAHLVDEDQRVDQAGLGHCVIVVVGREILMPLPDRAVERAFHVDHALKQVGVALQKLLHRPKQRGMPHEAPEQIAERLRVHHRAHGAAVILQDDLVAGEPAQPVELVPNPVDVRPEK